MYFLHFSIDLTFLICLFTNFRCGGSPESLTRMLLSVDILQVNNNHVKDVQVCKIAYSSQLSCIASQLSCIAEVAVFANYFRLQTQIFWLPFFLSKRGGGLGEQSEWKNYLKVIFTFTLTPLSSFLRGTIIIITINYLQRNSNNKHCFY